jgi:hypothetical protein
MLINRQKIRLDTINSISGTTIDIPLSIDFFPVDNSEVIENEFVDTEVQKAINPIVDNDKIRFIPSYTSVSTGNKFNIVPEIKINIYLIKSGTSKTHVTTYGDYGFSDDDIKYRRKRFTESFIRLEFYDKPTLNNNNLLEVINIPVQIGQDQKYIFVDNYNGSTYNITDNVNLDSVSLPSKQMPMSFRLSDPIKLSNRSSEGYNMFWYKDLVDSSPNGYKLYMQATFNDASNGKSLLLVNYNHNSKLSVQDILSDTGIRFMEYLLVRDNTDNGYKFSINKMSNKQNGIKINKYKKDIGSNTTYETIEFDLYQVINTL